MRFISNGDFMFPFHLPSYVAEHIYTWSYQQGAANPEGIIRLPGRLIDLVVFAAFGNLAASYFFLVSCLALAFIGFWWFAKVVLEVQRFGTIFLGSLFFACNPIFLGNISKIGLVLAVAMLPIVLAALKQGFTQKKFSYFLLAVAALNIALVHPFTFSVNLVVAGIYLVYLVRKNRVWARDKIWAFGLVVLTGLLLNAYLILPLVSLGTVDKGALSDQVSTSAPTDYSGLVDIANTGDIFTALSLSKGVLKDYEFFGALTWPFYFLGVFGFYALLFWLYVRVEKQAKPADRRRIVISLGIFLALLALSTASYLYADTLIKLLIDLPAGWMFRSPLKWQLYMPLVLFTALVVALKYVADGRSRKTFYVAFGVTFLLMNGYLFTQIYERLLTPRQTTHFSALQAADLTNKNLLAVNGAACISFARDNPAVTTELNQILSSKAVQVKRIDSGAVDTANLAQYDFVLSCANTVNEQSLAKNYGFIEAGTFANNTYQLYKNTRPRPYVSTAPRVFALEAAEDLAGKNAFVQATLKEDFNFVTDHKIPGATSLQDMFEHVQPKNITGDKIKTEITVFSDGQHKLFVTHDKPIYANIQDKAILLSAAPQAGMHPLPKNSSSVMAPLSKSLSVSYEDPAFSYQNIIPNPSLEEGLWQETIGDCNAYDDQPSLKMNLTKTQKTDGQQALELQTGRHIACTGPDEIEITEGGHYLLSFDYQTMHGRAAGYFVGFNDPVESSVSERLPESEGKWATFSKEIVVPASASYLKLLLYGFPSSNFGETGTARYDNFKLLHIPRITNHYFLLQDDHTPATTPNLTFDTLNPTKTLLHITSASEPFYISTKESYHNLWELRPNTGRSGLIESFMPWSSAKLLGEDHLRLNGSMNGWYIDPQVLCSTPTANCIKNPDGTYAMELVMEFRPQRWFYLGCLITLMAASGATLFAIYEIRQAREERKGKRA
jgi:hypothetical protein